MESEIPNLVERLLNGEDVVEELIKIHIAHVRKIARNIGRRYPSKSSDILSVAFLALTKAVNLAAPPPLGKGRLKDKEVTKFITKWVKGSIWNFLRDDHIVKTKDGSSVVTINESSDYDEEEGSLELFETIKDEDEEIRREQDEKIKHLLSVIEKTVEVDVLLLRLEGYTIREIAQYCGISTGTVSNIIESLKQRIYD